MNAIKTGTMTNLKWIIKALIMTTSVSVTTSFVVEPQFGESGGFISSMIREPWILFYPQEKEITTLLFESIPSIYKRSGGIRMPPDLLYRYVFGVQSTRRFLRVTEQGKEPHYTIDSIGL
jgi:hypothetical protein